MSIKDSLEQFVASYHIPMDFKERRLAIQREDIELQTALIEYGVDPSELIDELADRILTGMLFLMSLHRDPEAVVREKIEKVFEKYSKQSEG